jgi:hypothetical protein
LYSLQNDTFWVNISTKVMLFFGIPVFLFTFAAEKVAKG